MPERPNLYQGQRQQRHLRPSQRGRTNLATDLLTMPEWDHEHVHGLVSPLSAEVTLVRGMQSLAVGKVDNLRRYSPHRRPPAPS